MPPSPAEELLLRKAELRLDAVQKELDAAIARGKAIDLHDRAMKLQRKGALSMKAVKTMFGPDHETQPWVAHQARTANSTKDGYEVMMDILEAGAHKLGDQEDKVVQPQPDDEGMAPAAKGYAGYSYQTEEDAAVQTRAAGILQRRKAAGALK